MENTEEGSFRENLTLFPVRVGIQGIQKLHEAAIFLVENDPSWESEPALEPEPEQTFQAMLSTEETEETTGPILSFISQPQYFSPDNDGVNDELTMLLGARAETGIASWSLEVREPQPPYLLFYRIEGKSSPPDRLVWNGRSNRGELVQAATDYPFTYAATDREGHSSSLEGTIGVDVLVIRDEDGDRLRIQVPSIIFRAGYADFVDLSAETVENNNRVLRRIAAILNKFRDYKVMVEGHANRTQLDNEQEELSELQPLSESRAKAIVTRLTEFGVNQNRLSSVGMGSTKPVATFEDRNNWWKNRRVEFILIR
jgi:flagellar motor protein MotB